jgi:hypothetical protein
MLIEGQGDNAETKPKAATETHNDNPNRKLNMPKSKKNIKLRDQKPRHDPKGGRTRPSQVPQTADSSPQRIRPGQAVQ